jgi:hypothetical protein
MNASEQYDNLRRGPALWSYDGQAKVAILPLLPHASFDGAAEWYPAPF